MKSSFLFVVAGLMAFAPATLTWADTLVPGTPIELTGTHGKFDFIKIDPKRHRLLACHTGNGSLDVIDVADQKLIKSIPTGAAQGVAIDDKNGLYYVSISKPPKLVTIDAEKLEVIGEVPLPGPADLVALQPSSNKIFVCNDEKPEIWMVRPGTREPIIKYELPGAGMEDLAFDDNGTVLFQNIKEASELAKIDPVTGKILAKWPTLPAAKPHGLAIVPGTGTVLIAGGTGKLVLMSLADGKILASADIAPKVDQIAYDPGMHRAYGASGTGVLSVVNVEGGELVAHAPVPSATGDHSVAVDPVTHTVWVVFAKDNKAYAQAFTLKPGA